MFVIPASGLENCWEILNCDRQENGQKVNELGECIASKEKMGHSCWAIAGTLCGGTVQGSVAEKQASCMKCNVYKRYHRAIGSDGKLVKKYHPEEDEKYSALLIDRLNKRYDI
ncbi:MAG: hypothetical protein OEM02_05055 [Desulfobulbaceae bacterium]|nr:hypothetical protein [Desulfobulbaceae bacterium]